MSRKDFHSWLLRYRGKYKVSPKKTWGKKCVCSRNLEFWAQTHFSTCPTRKVGLSWLRQVILGLLHKVGPLQASTVASARWWLLPERVWGTEATSVHDGLVIRLVNISWAPLFNFCHLIILPTLHSTYFFLHRQGQINVELASLTAFKYMFP